MFHHYFSQIRSFIYLESFTVTEDNSGGTKSQNPNENIEIVILISIDVMGTMLEEDQNKNFKLTPIPGSLVGREFISLF